MSSSNKRYRLDLRGDGGWGLVPLRNVTNAVLDSVLDPPSVLDPSPPAWLSVIMAAAKVGGYAKSYPGSSGMVVYFTTDQDHNLIAFTDWRGEPLAWYLLMALCEA